MRLINLILSKLKDISRIAMSPQIYAEYLSVPQRSRKNYQNGPGHSKLAPFAEQIKLWQAQGMTLREITAELQHYGCQTTVQNLSLFLRKQR